MPASNRANLLYLALASSPLKPFTIPLWYTNEDITRSMGNTHNMDFRKSSPKNTAIAIEIAEEVFRISIFLFCIPIIPSTGILTGANTGVTESQPEARI